VDALGGNGLAEHLADAVVQVGEDHNLPTMGYHRQSAHAGGDRFGGSMLQIFVHRELVEKYAYPSQPYGVPLAGGILQYIEKQHRVADGQARLYFEPTVMMDPSKARLFHYCARPSQASMDPVVPSSRGSLIRKLRTVLSPILDGDARLDTAKRLGLVPV